MRTRLLKDVRARLKISDYRCLASRDVTVRNGRYVAWTRATSMLGVHNVLEFVDDRGSMHVLVDERDALLHHYRQWSGDQLRLGSDTPVVDRRMRQLRADVVARTADRHRRRRHDDDDDDVVAPRPRDDPV